MGYPEGSAHHSGADFRSLLLARGLLLLLARVAHVAGLGLLRAADQVLAVAGVLEVQRADLVHLEHCHGFALVHVGSPVVSMCDPVTETATPKVSHIKTHRQQY